MRNLDDVTMNFHIKVLLTAFITLVNLPNSIYSQEVELFDVPKIDTVLSKKYDLNISMPRYIYIQYEPINVEVKFINNDSIPLELWGNFKGPCKIFFVKITDNNGYKYANDFDAFNKVDCMMTGPSYIIQPKDTLYARASFNNYGREIKLSPDWFKNYYFGSRGYFEPGNYSANFKATFEYHPGNIRGDRDAQSNKQISVSSNDIKFVVVGINDTDREIMDLYKQGDFLNNHKPYEEIINRFPNHRYTEEVYFIDYLGGKYLNHRKDEEYIKNLETDYRNFIYKYPNSLYLLDDRLIEPYIYYYFIDFYTNMLKDDFIKLLGTFRELNADNYLRFLLKDEMRVKMILGLERFK
jgi:hypothetical protein